MEGTGFDLYGAADGVLLGRHPAWLQDSCLLRSRSWVPNLLDAGVLPRKFQQPACTWLGIHDFLQEICNWRDTLLARKEIMEALDLSSLVYSPIARAMNPMLRLLLQG